jgi:hypothetical protein
MYAIVSELKFTEKAKVDELRLPDPLAALRLSIDG